MKQPFKQLTIAEQGGIEQKLNNERDKHHSFGYTEFDIFANIYESGKIPLTSLASLMNMKSTKTIKVWLTERKKLKLKENNNDRTDSN